MSPTKVQRYSLRNVLEEAEIQSRSWFLMVDKGDDESFKGLKSGQNSFSICVCWVNLYVSVVGLHIMREHPDYWELP